MGARISFGEPIVIVDGKKIDSNHIASLEVLKDIDQPDMAAISLSNFGDGGGGGTDVVYFDTTSMGTEASASDGGGDSFG